MKLTGMLHCSKNLPSLLPGLGGERFSTSFLSHSSFCVIPPSTHFLLLLWFYYLGHSSLYLVSTDSPLPPSSSSHYEGESDAIWGTVSGTVEGEPVTPSAALALDAPPLQRLPETEVIHDQASPIPPLTLAWHPLPCSILQQAQPRWTCPLPLRAAYISHPSPRLNLNLTLLPAISFCPRFLLLPLSPALHRLPW